jgi:hypothetical protein
VPAVSATPQPAKSGQTDPVQLQTQADIAVALTAALTNRMKPPLAPRRDLRPSTAIWMLLTGVSLAMIFATLFTKVDLLVPAIVLGVVQILSGYIWIIVLTQRRESQRGLWCAIPPLTFYYLTQYKYAKLRPLRFVVTGAVIAVVCLLVSPLLPRMHAIFHRSAPTPVVVQPDPTTLSKLEQLRMYRDQRSYDSLIKLLELLTQTDPLLSEDAKDRVALSAELKALCQHQLTEVRVQAMDAYARWDRPSARLVCLAAVKSPAYEERRMALRLLPQWKDSESARAVQLLIGRPGTVETIQAKAALEEIGGSPAEEAAIMLLNRAEDPGTKLTALSILEKVGSLETARSLRNYAMATDDSAVREKAIVTADAIDARLRVPTPGPAPVPAPAPAPKQ